MKRAYYSNTISGFIEDESSKIHGELAKHHKNRSLDELQINAWEKQIHILKDQLIKFEGRIYFEFSIPRMGKRVDNILIIEDIIFIVEFKVGDGEYESYAQDQVIDYTLDMQNFHEGSHHVKLIPVLVATNASFINNDISKVKGLELAAKTNKDNLSVTLTQFLDGAKKNLNVDHWEKSIYKPTPTIIEAAQALYKGHNVEEISRSDAGAINLSKTANCINRVIEDSKTNNKKSICFVTGVPGAGKTLAGLNIANQWMRANEDEHSVFLSGNGPLVAVLREALARDLVETKKEEKAPITKAEAKRRTSSFIQNIHHFRDEYYNDKSAPTDKVIVFDEAQRAWNHKQVASFMKRKKGEENFTMSEPEFLIDVMNRHKDWCTIICLIGGGQEINTGEAGLGEWINALKNEFQDWNVLYSSLITENNNYIKSDVQTAWLQSKALSGSELHLAVSVRSFRSEKISEFIFNLLELRIEKSKQLFFDIREEYPIVLTRDLKKAKQWLRKKAKGTERIGLVASSGARRLKANGIDVKNEIDAENWFLNPKSDVRSSYFLEDIATEFDIQGLEIDWTCLAWGANFYIEDMRWKYQSFQGSRWLNIKQEVSKDYLKNTYRVLLTRARQGLIIYLPKGSEIDHTRPHKFYDETFAYLKEIGIQEV